MNSLRLLSVRLSKCTTFSPLAQEKPHSDHLSTYSSGNVTALGSWATASAVALSASKYTTSNPLWSAAVSFVPGTVVVYKYIVVSTTGTVEWEADPNHTLTFGCVATTVSSSWQD